VLNNITETRVTRHEGLNILDILIQASLSGIALGCVYALVALAARESCTVWR